MIESGNYQNIASSFKNPKRIFCRRIRTNMDHLTVDIIEVFEFMYTNSVRKIYFSPRAFVCQITVSTLEELKLRIESFVFERILHLDCYDV